MTRPLALGAASAAAVVAALSGSAALAAGPERAYELVSPVDKHGTDVLGVIGGTADGNAVVYNAYGTYADAPSAVFTPYYRSERTATGWTTTAISPTQTDPRTTSLASGVGPIDFTADMRTMWVTPTAWTQPLVPEDRNGAADVYASTVGGGLVWQSPGVDPAEPGESVYAGRSDDGRHVVFESERQILPSVPGGTRQVYEIVDGVTRLASIVGGSPAPSGATFGGSRVLATLPAVPDRRAISADGSHIFFTAGGELHVRVDGEHTELISASQAAGHEGEPSGGALFEGASDDGRYVTFTSDAVLVDGASRGGLYGYDLRDGHLRLLAERTQQLLSVKLAGDGSRAYFVTDQPIGGEGTSDTGMNFWVARTDGTALHRIGRLDPNDFRLWGLGEGQNLAAVAPGDTRLAFESVAQLTSWDNGGTRQVYVYDDATRTITCASCPADGAAPVGAGATLLVPNPYKPTTPRTWTADGRLFFETSQPLVGADDDDAVDVYESGPDGVRLVSPGAALDVHYVDNAADGSTVFLSTRAGLVPADVDGGALDVYAARVGGGFPEPSAPCAGSACRGPQAPDLPLVPPLGTGTALDAAPGRADSATPTFKVLMIRPAARRALARTGRAGLRVRVSDAAILRVSGRGRIGTKLRTVASGTTHATRAGTVVLPLRLTATARRELRRRGRLTVRLTVRCSDTSRVQRRTVVLTKARPATTRKRKQATR